MKTSFLNISGKKRLSWGDVPDGWEYSFVCLFCGFHKHFVVGIFLCSWYLTHRIFLSYNTIDVPVPIRPCEEWVWQVQQCWDRVDTGGTQESGSLQLHAGQDQDSHWQAMRVRYLYLSMNLFLYSVSLSPDSDVARLFAKCSSKSCAPSEIAHTSSRTHKNKVCMHMLTSCVCVLTSVTARIWWDGVTECKLILHIGVLKRWECL